MQPMICPDCRAYVETLVDESRGRAERRYFVRCGQCGGTAATPADVAKRAAIAEGVPPEVADLIGRNLEISLTAHYTLVLASVER